MLDSETALWNCCSWHSKFVWSAKPCIHCVYPVCSMIWIVVPDLLRQNSHGHSLSPKINFQKRVLYICRRMSIWDIEGICSSPICCVFRTHCREYWSGRLCNNLLDLLKNHGYNDHLSILFVFVGLYWSFGKQAVSDRYMLPDDRKAARDCARIPPPISPISSKQNSFHHQR